MTATGRHRSGPTSPGARKGSFFASRRELYEGAELYGDAAKGARVRSCHQHLLTCALQTHYPSARASLKGHPQWVWDQTQGRRIIFLGMGIAAAIETAAAAATAAAPPPHRRTAGGLVRGPFFALCGGRFLGSVCLFFGLVCSSLVRWPRKVDAPSDELGFGRFRVRLCVTIRVRL